MNILSELSSLLTELDVPFEAGHYSGVPPDEYIVIIPLADSFEFAADNLPQADVQEARIAIYSKNNYYPLRSKLTKSLLQKNFVITDRRYIEFEAETKYHHAAVDVAKSYEFDSDIESEDE